MTPAAPSIAEKIARAHALMARHGPALLADGEVRDLLARYREEVARTRDLMRRLGVVALCARCAERTPGGTCCGEGIEDWYDEYLLLLNLLLETPIPEESALPGHCRFLGPAGCRLTARHDFCVNYLCHRVPESLAPAAHARLQAQNGAELFLAWRLERLVRERLGWRPG
ncbi:hypothetical protein G3N55_08145 [Dissulfurirhabdus thermomarina]|uniref:Uncharacterized protein n=1 Tax=Dissulfurirhabdus thermomarina TaxID=1765737 RepID=A0A6N9TND8_DISTH|nr:hypothetical protein [Dissulfurirhabdus thermomarina]NDY42812.1 hypothetical protein [Dissulfurirhabdus thermomarina]NMX24381.1 hypothetical protein [Dissulfurirhabdus thermomarina]